MGAAAVRRAAGGLGCRAEAVRGRVLPRDARNVCPRGPPVGECPSAASAPVRGTQPRNGLLRAWWCLRARRAALWACGSFRQSPGSSAPRPYPLCAQACLPPCWCTRRRFAVYRSIGLCISIYLSIYPSIHPSIHPSIYLSIHPSIYRRAYGVRHAITSHTDVQPCFRAAATTAGPFETSPRNGSHAACSIRRRMRECSCRARVADGFVSRPCGLRHAVRCIRRAL
jgi:hypothetical protein